jgi:transposase-like protein
MEQKGKRRSFDREFKQGALALVRGGQKVSEVARNLGIRENMLWRWKQEDEQAGAAAFPGQGHLGAADTEVKRLQKELERTQRERDILKKALAIFSTTPNQGIGL